MNRLEHVVSTSSPILEPIDALAMLAEESGARRIAIDVRRVRSELAIARYTVAVIGSPDARSRIVERICGRRIDAVLPVTTSIRFGRGSYVARRPDGTLVVSIDRLGLLDAGHPTEIICDTPVLRSGACFVLGDTSHASCVVMSGDGFLAEDQQPSAPVLVVDASADDIDRVLAWIATRAVENGAYSKSISEQALEAYDENCLATERRFCQLLDAVFETIRISTRFGRSAREEGAQGVVRARSQIARWSSTLAAVAVHFG